MAPRRRAREQQVRDVRAGDEQHQRDDHHDRRQRAPVSLAQRRAAVGRGPQREPRSEVARLLIRPPVLRYRRLAELRQDPPKRRFTCRQALAVLQPDHHSQPPGRPAIEVGLLPPDQRLGANRNRDVEAAPNIHAEELRRGHADDRARHALDDQRASDDVGRAFEAALPEGVADDGHRPVGSAAAHIVGGAECPSEDGGYAERIEDAAARPHAVDHLRLPATREVEASRLPREGAPEERLSLANLFPNRVGPARAPGRAGIAEADQLLRRFHRQRSQNQAVENGEDGAVRPNPERQRQHGDERDDRR
jgi:hypothetical protein